MIIKSLSQKGLIFSYHTFKCEECNSDNIIESVSFYRADFIKTIVKNYTFKNCDLSHIDARGAIFINCKFINCKFNYTNFAQAKFEKCEFIYEENKEINSTNYTNFSSPFEKASFFNTYFKESNFVNCFIKACNFRYSLFENCKFEKVINYSTSFERSKFKDCIVDTFDLRHSAIYGLVFNNLEFEKLILRIEKAVQIVGIDKYFDNKLTIEKENEQNILVIENLKSSDNNLKLENFYSFLKDEKLAIFETLNLLLIILQNKKLLQIEEEKHNIPISSHMKLLPFGEEEKIFYAYIKEVANNPKYHLFLTSIDLNLLLEMYKLKRLKNLYILKNLFYLFENVDDKFSIEYYLLKEDLPKIISKFTLKLENDLKIQDCIEFLQKFKNKLEEMGIYEDYHYQIIKIERGSSLFDFVANIFLLNEIKEVVLPYFESLKINFDIHVEFDNIPLIAYISKLDIEFNKSKSPKEHHPQSQNLEEQP